MVDLTHAEYRRRNNIQDATILDKNPQIRTQITEEGKIICQD